MRNRGILVHSVAHAVCFACGKWRCTAPTSVQVGQILTKYPFLYDRYGSVFAEKSLDVVHLTTSN